jgi:hypothetical protein
MPFRRTSIDSDQRTGFYLPKLSRVVGSRLLSSPLPAIGDAFEGGFYAGLISHTANNVATHALIVAPRATGATGTGYTLSTNYTWKNALTTTSGTTSTFDGAVNTAAMVTAGIANHPAANFCVGLSINGYTDWYLPARFENDIAYQNLKPTTNSNNTLHGTNLYAVPQRTSNRTASVPGITSAVAFQSGGAEAFVASSHWSSNEFSASVAWRMDYTTGAAANTSNSKTSSYAVRAFRKIAL